MSPSREQFIGLYILLRRETQQRVQYLVLKHGGIGGVHGDGSAGGLFYLFEGPGVVGVAVGQYDIIDGQAQLLDAFKYDSCLVAGVDYEASFGLFRGVDVAIGLVIPEG